VARADHVTGAILAVGGLAVTAWAWQLPGGTAQDPIGPRGFPALLGLGLAACGLALLAVRARPGESPSAAAPSGGTGAAARLIGAVVLVGLYVRLLEPLGYPVATPLFLAAALGLQGGVPLRALLGSSLGLPAALYLFFAGIMKIPLPLGLLERLTLGP
jgi:putative tricarboxylic transport membrane protein